MCRLIDNAKTEILLESYIFSLDQVGNKIVKILNKKAAQGLTVKLNLDAVGSHYYQCGRHWKSILHENVSLRWFHRWNWRRPWQFNVRNHRKLLVIDRSIAFIGGFNIHRESSRQYFGEKRWRDTHMKLQSDAVALLAQYFSDIWLIKHQIYYDSNKEFLFIPNLSRKCRYLLRCQLSQLINNARTSIQVTTPYFVPDEYLIKDLINASQRGVEVSLLVPHCGDHPLINSMAWAYYSRLTQSGIRIFAYLPRMLHAKTTVVDSHIVIIGSANMDYRSLFVNYELVCLFASRKVAEELSENFRRDCDMAELVTPKTRQAAGFWWLKRPIATLLKHWI
tara:strand:- start:12658 stop:13665 length:1008 start_codon:yes stop_codon:yes gene_type:complete